jgi:hypothetical protein
LGEERFLKVVFYEEADLTISDEGTPFWYNEYFCHEQEIVEE